MEITFSWSEKMNFPLPSKNNMEQWPAWICSLLWCYDHKIEYLTHFASLEMENF